MASLQHTPSANRTLLLNSFPQVGGQQRHGGFLRCCGRNISFFVRAEQSSPASTTSHFQDGFVRRQMISLGVIAPWILVINQTPVSFAAETKKGFLSVMDKKDGYSFLYPFGWQEVAIEGQDKVFKDVIEPLESVSINMIPTSKGSIREFGPPQQREDDGKTYYTFEFVAQAPNYTRHALSTISIGNGKFYTLTTGAKERRWEKMKEKLHTVVDSFQIFNV